MIIDILDVKGYGPYGNYGLSEIKRWMNSGVLPDHMKTMEYTNENIKKMLKWLGIEENENSKRTGNQNVSDFSIKRRMYERYDKK